MTTNFDSSTMRTASMRGRVTRFCGGECGIASSAASRSLSRMVSTVYRVGQMLTMPRLAVTSARDGA